MGKNGPTAVLEHTQETTTKKARFERLDHEKPYSAEVVIEGLAHLICHRYDCAEVESKGKAVKGSKTKKSDNIESYVYRDPDTNEVGVPGVNFKACLVDAARSIQDPRSPRKCARDLVRASILVAPELSSLGKKTWDFEDRRPAVVQRNRITRVRPAFHRGWRLTFIVNVLQPNYVTPALLEQIVKHAGAFHGLGDFRPDFGRFTIRKFEVRDFCEAN